MVDAKNFDPKVGILVNIQTDTDHAMVLHADLRMRKNLLCA